jgi:HSP20 family protein
MVNIVRRSGEEGREVAARRAPFWEPLRMMRELMRWDPFAELESMTGAQPGGFMPPVEIRETPDAYLFKADLPGVSEQGVDISLTGNRLTISGRREEETRDEGDRYFTYECAYGEFSRSFTLPEGIDPENVRADMKSGVLTVSVPKRPEVKPRRIDIGRAQAGGTGRLQGTEAGRTQTQAPSGQQAPGGQQQGGQPPQRGQQVQGGQAPPRQPKG